MTQPAASTVPLPLRHDTMFGVCEGLGEEFGFHANWLRLGLVAPLFFWPTLTIAAYFALGGVLALARWMVPSAAATQAPVAVIPAPSAGAPEADDYRLAA